MVLTLINVKIILKMDTVLDANMARHSLRSPMARKSPTGSYGYFTPETITLESFGG